VNCTTKPSRPLLRWHGGKWRIAHWIVKFFPEHRVYTEAFGGGGSVLLKKERSKLEVWNDLDKSAVNLFRIMRDRAQASELRRRLFMTPFSRAEFDLSYEYCADPMESARRLVVRSYQGFGSNAHNMKTKTGFRSGSSGSERSHAHGWANYPRCMSAIINRLRGVVIENIDAAKVMLKNDFEDALHYVDPPYLHSTRGDGHDHKSRYSYELFGWQHEELADVLRDLKGMVILSSYDSAMYKRLYSDWHSFHKQARTYFGQTRIETIWVNPACFEKLDSKWAV